MLMREYFRSKGFGRIVVLLMLVLIFIALRSMLNLLLLTFILAYLLNRSERAITSFLSRWVRVSPRIIIIILYTLFVSGLVIGITKYLPEIIDQISMVVKEIREGYMLLPSLDNDVINYLLNAVEQLDLQNYMVSGIDLVTKYLANIGKWGLIILLSLLLSLFFLLEKARIKQFTSKFKASKIAFIYNEMEYFGNKFIGSFGKVIEVQFLIAFVNCILSVFMLWILGFPQLVALGVLIFLLGLIPVAGVIISLIPLTIIGFSIGGLRTVIYVLIMIAVIHAIESYILNPKLMSHKTNLPVFYTFIVLIFGEHFFGVWGLILGIPLFIFILDILDVHAEEKPADAFITPGEIRDSNGAD